MGNVRCQASNMGCFWKLVALLLLIHFHKKFIFVDCQSSETTTIKYSDEDGNTNPFPGYHGGLCNNTIPCIPHSNLFCNPASSTCTCLRPNQMIFDVAQKKCLIKQLEKCRFEFTDGSGKTLYETYQCVRGFQCSPHHDYTCNCGQDSFISKNASTCITKRSLSESCSSNNECNNELSLVCVGGVCTCNSETTRTPQYYSFNADPGNVYSNRKVTVTSEICASKVGVVCSNSKRHEEYFIPLRKGQLGISSVDDKKVPLACVPGAYCSKIYQGFLAPWQYKCKCSKYYTRSQDSTTCIASYGFKCFSTDQCRSGLRCIDEKCTCPNGDYDVYEGSECRHILGGPCSIQESNKCHTPNAVCKRLDNNVERCVCDTGYVEEGCNPLKRTCKVDYGFKCNLADDCHSGLSCINGKCQCKSKYTVFDEVTRKCLKTVGLPCDYHEECVATAGCFPRTKYGYEKHCVPNESISSISAGN